MILGYWYFVECKPSEDPLDETDHPAENRKTAALIESSTSFDLSDFRPFLQQLQAHVSGGFGQRTVDHIADLATRMKHEEARSLEYVVTFRGQQCPLKIRLFRDDVAEITPYFHSPKPLAELIDSAMESLFLGTRHVITHFD